MHVAGYSFNEVYNKLALLLNSGYEHCSSPRGMKIKESLAVSFRIANPRDRGIFNPARKFKTHYTVAECLWYLSGNDKTAWISYYAPFWSKISDDGETANSAYGARIFKSHTRICGAQIVQWDWVKGELTNDPDSRRAIIHIKSPWDSTHAKLDVPCTLALQFLIRDNRLHMVVNMRSSDLILGIANDVPAFTLLQELMAYELGVELGTYTHVSNSLHVYERHWDMLSSMCDKDNTIRSEALHAEHGPHPPLPSSPPTDELMQFESELRAVDSTPELRSVLARIDFGEYWNDWALMLASYRAKVLGDKVTFNEITARTFFGGSK
jgi:thymidylate synthase